MTPKELLYLEDTLNLEQQLQIKCTDYSSKVQDASLKTALTDFAQKHQEHYNVLLSQLNQ